MQTRDAGDDSHFEPVGRHVDPRCGSDRAVRTNEFWEQMMHDDLAADAIVLPIVTRPPDQRLVVAARGDFLYAFDVRGKRNELK